MIAKVYLLKGGDSLRPQVKIERTEGGERLRLTYMPEYILTPGYVRMQAPCSSIDGGGTIVYDYRSETIEAAKGKNYSGIISAINKMAKIKINGNEAHLYPTEEENNSQVMLSEWITVKAGCRPGPSICFSNPIWGKETVVSYQTPHPGHPQKEIVTNKLLWTIALTNNDQILIMEDRGGVFGLNGRDQCYGVRVGANITVAGDVEYIKR